MKMLWNQWMSKLQNLINLQWMMELRFHCTYKVSYCFMLQ